MPRRDDIGSVLVIGSGPIVIGQAAEFDYSGTQACRVLKAEGLRVILINSNPATIMTDPEFADATYVEPITPEVVEQIIAKERPDALLPTLGGQTALNTAIALHEAGVLRKYDVELIGANVEAIQRGENRERFKEIVAAIGGESARSRICHSMAECQQAVAELGYPVVVRPSFTMGGAGSGFAYNEEDLRRIAGAGLLASPTTEVLLEESILGWKEYELELMRDHNDNVVVVCSIENFDPMGVHTGDSITVAPSLTLTDREYQRLRDLGIDIIRAVGVDTGGCNIQFAVNPDDGRIIVIEMNPRVSRSSALASKATGIPHRQDRGTTGHRLQPGRDPQRHHRRDPGVVRADAGLHRGEGAALRLREVPERRPRADHHHEERRRGDGHRTQLPRSAAEGAAVHREARRALPTSTATRPRWTCRACWSGWRLRPTAASTRCSERCGRGASIEQVHEATHIDPWFLDQICQHQRDGRRDGGGRAHGRRSAAPGQAARLLRRPDRRRSATYAGGRRARRAPCPGRAPGLQDRRHLRRRVRCSHALPLLLLRRGERGRAGHGTEGDHPRLRPQPDRPGHRVRLLLRPRLADAARGRLRDGDGQLQPGDRLHRLRHQQSPVLRAAHAGGRAGGRARRVRAPARSPGSSCSWAGRPRWAWRRR